MLIPDHIVTHTHEQLKQQLKFFLENIINEHNHASIQPLVECASKCEIVMRHDEYTEMVKEIIESYMSKGNDQSLILWLLGMLKIYSLIENIMTKVRESDASNIDLNYCPQQDAGVYAELSLAAVIASLHPSQAIYVESILKMKRQFKPCLVPTPRSAFYLFKYAIFCNKPVVIQAIANYDSFMDISLPSTHNAETPFEIALNNTYAYADHASMPFIKLLELFREPNLNRSLSSGSINNPNSLTIITPEQLKHLNYHAPTLLWLLAKQGRWSELLVIVKSYKGLIFNTVSFDGDDKFKSIAVLASEQQQWLLVNAILDNYYLLKQKSPNKLPYGSLEIELIFMAAYKANKADLVAKIFTYFPKISIKELIQHIEYNPQHQQHNTQLAKLLAFHGSVIHSKDVSPAIYDHYCNNMNSIFMKFKKVARIFFSQEVEFRFEQLQSDGSGELEIYKQLPLEIREVISVCLLKMLDPELSSIDDNVLVIKMRDFYQSKLPAYDMDFIYKLCLAEYCRNNNVKFKKKIDVVLATFDLIQIISQINDARLIHDRSFRNKIVRAVGARQDTLLPKLSYEWCLEAVKSCKNEDGSPLVHLVKSSSIKVEEQTAEIKEEETDIKESDNKSDCTFHVTNK